MRSRGGDASTRPGGTGPAHSSSRTSSPRTGTNWCLWFKPQSAVFCDVNPGNAYEVFLLQTEVPGNSGSLSPGAVGDATSQAPAERPWRDRVSALCSGAVCAHVTSGRAEGSPPCILHKRRLAFSDAGSFISYSFLTNGISSWRPYSCRGLPSPKRLKGPHDARNRGPRWTSWEVRWLSGAC